ncbi:MAG: DNA primase [Muribaculaceae bacterium]|nr:DNA primase [Muribaculaceae bacterium]
MIDRETQERIKDAADIVEVVSDYVHLTRRGANLMGLCPFHNEKTPSFSVSPRKNICYCFSCHKGGSPVNFIMEKEGVSYYDALRQLAKKYGITIEERELSDEERARATKREGLMIAAQRAMQIMEHDLTESQQGRDVGLSYLYGRGITQEAIKRFHLGYAIDSGQYLTPKMQREGFDPEILRELGLTGLSQNGNLYDKYRGRVIFPILNPAGRVVGFGGRDLKGGPAKYINSPESALYRKNQELYGIFQAKAEITRQDRCFLVEGYLDVISMWQSGMQNVVASSGTALTDGQIALIHRFTDNITLLYDGDAAGIKAALRGIDMLLSHKMHVNVLLLPDGHDPDSFARANTPEEFRQYVDKNSTDIIRFKMRVLMQDAGDSPQRKAEVINSVAYSIACIPDEVQRTIYIAECSRELHIDEGAVARAVQNAHYAILEQRKRDRNRRDAERDYPVASPSAPSAPATPGQAQTPEITAGGNAQSAPSTVQFIRPAAEYPMKPIETNLIRYLVRYGYLAMHLDDLTPVTPADGGDTETEVLYTITDYVDEELQTYQLQFSTPAYAKVFDLLLNRLNDYVGDLERYKLQISTHLAAERQQLASLIPERVSTLDDIEREEKLLDESIRRRRDEMLYNFALNYPRNYLTSHEDDDVRRVATELIAERHVLSNIYSRNTTSQEQELKDLAMKTMRSIEEWRSELLNIEVRQLLRRLQSIEDEDSEEARDLQRQIGVLMMKRAKIAKECGERIISSR